MHDNHHHELEFMIQKVKLIIQLLQLQLLTILFNLESYVYKNL